jgi:hypothetical protein
MAEFGRNVTYVKFSQYEAWKPIFKRHTRYICIFVLHSLSATEAFSRDVWVVTKEKARYDNHKLSYQKDILISQQSLSKEMHN